MHCLYHTGARVGSTRYLVFFNLFELYASHSAVYDARTTYLYVRVPVRLFVTLEETLWSPRGHTTVLEPMYQVGRSVKSY